MKTLILLLSLSVSTAFAANYSSPAGLWKTVDDKSGKTASVVKLWQHNGALFGKVVKIYPVNGNKPTDRCVKCPGKLRNQPVLGITFMWNLRRTKANVWSGGQIMDPKIGKIYRCKLELANNGKVLHVRGYIGIPLLGRTQSWYRK